MDMDNHSLSLQQGMSLIGMLVAIFILVAVAATVTRLMAHTEQTVGQAQEKFVAANLAREGLELVQAQRDSNWFAPTPTECIETAGEAGRDTCWAVALCGVGGDDTSSEYQFTIDYDPAAGILALPVIHEDQAQLYIDPTTSLWTHVTSPQPTRYRRLLTADCSQQNAEIPIVTVASRVTWDSRGQEQNIVVHERLYNWFKQ